MPEPRYKPDSEEQDEGFTEDPLLVYDYAIGGNTVQGVARQVEEQFLGPDCVGTKPQWALWDSNNTLFGKLASNLTPGIYLLMYCSDLGRNK